LRAKIAACKKFILLASPNALASRWVPWELGYADSKKGLEHIAILPVRYDDAAYPSNEYLRIYPSIESTDTSEMAVFPAGQSTGGRLLYWWIAR
jgi:hypothetical protein